MEAVAHNIKEVLPSMLEDKCHRLALHLSDECGVEDVADLAYVKEDDMKEYLKPIQCRKLLDKWKPKENQLLLHSPQLVTTVSACAQIPCDSRPSSSAEVTEDIVALVHKPVNNWQINFQVPWNKFGTEIKRCLQNNKRPHPRARREMVRKLVDEIRTLCLNPTRQQLSHVASEIVKKYPDSFIDKMDAGEVIGSGYTSILNQLKARVENLNRVNNENTLRTVVGGEEQCEVSCNRKRKADSYGCVNWQPQLSDDNSKENMLQLKNKLKEMYLNGPKNCDHVRVDKMMSDSYALQRLHINSQLAASIELLQTEWPFLFHERWLLLHFDNLIGVSLREKLLSTNKANKIIDFMKCVCVAKDVRQQMDCILCEFSQYEPTEDLAVVFMLLLRYFQEEHDCIMKLVEPTSSAADVNPAGLPVTPCLLIFGDTILESERYMLAVDQKVVCEEISDFSSGLAMLFAAFYVFNIMYPEEAGTALEFIQRCFVCINPETGTKVSKGTKKKKKESISPKVVTLIKELSDFEWMDKH
ncbi:Uncharacterised protein g5950 [Pycnogonum litorale]